MLLQVEFDMNRNIQFSHTLAIWSQPRGTMSKPYPMGRVFSYSY
jgi:hypothetical protein